MSTEQDYLTVTEAARVLSVSNFAIYRAVRRGDLPATEARTGHSHLLIPAAAVNAYRTRRHDTADLTDRGGMLRTGQVAAILGVGTRAVKAMCLRGDLSYVHGNGPRGHLRIFRASVERYLDRLYQPS